MGRAEGSEGPNGVLRGGQFYSPVVSQQRQEHLVLTELWQPTGRKLPRHQHELAYVTVVLDGHYEEGSLHGLTELRPPTAIFNPSGIAHTALVGQTGTKLFTIECSPQFLEQLDVRLPDQPVVDPGSGAMLWPGMWMFSAFKTQTADALVLESHLACLIHEG
jgi:hypothetical protein